MLLRGTGKRYGIGDEEERFGVVRRGDSEEIGDVEALMSAAEDVGVAREAMLLKMLGL